MNYLKISLILIVIASVITISAYFVSQNDDKLLTAKDALDRAEQLTADITEEMQLISIVSDNCTVDGMSEVWTITYFSSEPVAVINNNSVLNKYSFVIYANGTHELYEGNDNFVWHETSITNWLIDSSEASRISRNNQTVIDEMDNIREFNHVQIYSQDNVTYLLIQYTLTEPSNGSSNLVCKLDASTGDILSVYYR